jgi:hypothetical protein
MKKAAIYFIGWVIIASLLIFNFFLFNHFLKLNYFKWFIAQGAFISIITGFVYIFREKDTRDLGLISDHPFDFMGAQLQVLGMLFLALGDGLKGSRVTKFHLQVDSILTQLILLPLAVILICWFLVVIPCQYVVYFICGAPSRLFETSNLVRTVESSLPSDKEEKLLQKTSFALDIKKKPFEFTNTLAALVLFVLGQIL